MSQARNRRQAPTAAGRLSGARWRRPPAEGPRSCPSGRPTLVSPLARLPPARRPRGPTGSSLAPSHPLRPRRCSCLPRRLPRPEAHPRGMAPPGPESGPFSPAAGRACPPAGPLASAVGGPVLHGPQAVVEGSPPCLVVQAPAACGPADFGRACSSGGGRLRPPFLSRIVGGGPQPRRFSGWPLPPPVLDRADPGSVANFHT